MLPYWILACAIYWIISYKIHTTINLNYQFRRGIINLNYVMDRLLYQMFKIILNKLPKKHETLTENPPMKIHANKIENRITFKIKSGNYLGLLMPKTIK